MGPKAATTTKKTAAPAKSTKPKHPTYQIMISAAIAHYKDKTGSSQPAIIKFIEANYDVAIDTYKTQLRMALKRLIGKGVLVMVKASYKLTEEGKKEYKALIGETKPKRAPAKPKAETVAATTTKKVVKKPSTTTSKAAPTKPATSAAAKKNAAKPPAKAASKKPAAVKKAAPTKKAAAKK